MDSNNDMEWKQYSNAVAWLYFTWISVPLYILDSTNKNHPSQLWKAILVKIIMVSVGMLFCEVYRSLFVEYSEV
jgi:nitric oxide reductase large subunit